MTNLFTIKTMEVRTDANGVYAINPANDAGYNVFPSSYASTEEGVYAITSEVNQSSVTKNQLFNSMLSNVYSLNEIHGSPSTRLYGISEFKATNGGGQPIAYSVVNVLVVLWH